MVTILLTGSEGQLGKAIRKAAKKYPAFIIKGIDINDLDLTNESEVVEFFNTTSFQYILNCAAYTAVDKAESEKEVAFSVNAAIPALLGKICTEKGGRLIHFSTDYIYDGKLGIPHTEEEEPLPLSVYAKSKLDGEKALWNNKNAMVFRTSWLYSEFGNNFLKTMIRLSKEKKELQVVYDQVGTPTYAGHLAETMMHIIAFSESNGFKPGIYNYSNEGVCSWYDFATEIMTILLSDCLIRPVRTDEYPQVAKRPEFGVMDKRKIKTAFGIHIPHWKEGLVTAIKNLENSNSVV